MRRYRQRMIVLCALALAVLTLLAVSLCTFFGNKLQKLRGRAEMAEQELAVYRSETVSVLCVSKNIEAGKEINEEDLVIGEFPIDSVPENTILDLSDAVGRTAKIPLYKNTYLTTDMLYESALLGPEREIEYFCIDVNGNVTKGSFVDVRLCFEDGSDYVVLSRKRIEGISEDRNSVILHVNEEELLRMGNAVAKLKEHEGRRIYAVEYPYGELQEPSIVDYVP
ncbi:MAG: flagella basal body P-ring formation protein FlgA [Lachnospiraceae bacterium]|nr:flagella basal body P-ring formation protein FlgA [Lachnospiraceae bacterium]